MTDIGAPFDPTAAPVGRLARLGVVLDLGQPIDRIRGLAILCDRAGVDAVWLADRAHLDTPGAWTDPHGAASVVAGVLTRARLGVLVTDGTAPPPAEAREVLLGRVRGDRDGADARTVARAPSEASGGDVDAVGVTGGSGRVRRSSLLWDLADVADDVFATADDVCLVGWRFPDLETAADEVRAEAAEAGRDPATLGVAALLVVSIGRTQAEAEARLVMDPAAARLGHPGETGIFGTLEECQDRVIALAHAGVTDLRCVLPSTGDIPDVIAQLTAMTVGTTKVLTPGSLRSPAPPPPDGWGGRADLPLRPQVSGGSRRR